MDLKLSEAIRQGAKLHPPTEYGWENKDANGTPRTCALVAACEAAGLVFHDGNLWQLGPNGVLAQRELFDVRTGCLMEPQSYSIQMPEAWTTLLGSIQMPPCACQVYKVADMVQTIIWHLHDIHHWSREAAAEWIGTLEEKIERMTKSDLAKEKRRTPQIVAEKV